MPDVKKLRLEEALSHIQQKCERVERPFFFIVGAGVSNPPVKLALQMVEDFKKQARKRGRNAEPTLTRPIDIYSHWFSQAIPDPSERQNYLRRQIVGKYISHASFRLAHILLNKAIANLVITPNFDDFLSRALYLFGKQPIVFDEPETFGRVDPERDDIQIVHVHGSYRFYDCSNLKEEILQQAEDSNDQPSKTASIIQAILSQRSPLVVGYSGWEGDVIMTALRHSLVGHRLPNNVYWFCFREANINDLPDWLKYHINVYFVIPNDDMDNKNELVRTSFAAPFNRNASLSNVESTVSPSIVSTQAYGRKKPALVLSARDVFDKLIQTFNLEVPKLTIDPLAYFVEQMSKSLPQDEGDEKSVDIYSLRAVIERIQKAKEYEEEVFTLRIESELEKVRNALRASDYGAVIQEADIIDPQQLSDEQRKNIIAALWEAVPEIYGDTKQESSAYDKIISTASLLRNSSFDRLTRIAFAKSLAGKGLISLQDGDYNNALASFDEVLSRFRKADYPDLQEALAMALVNKGVALRKGNQNEEAISIYDRVIRRFGSTRITALKRGVIRALFNKAVILRALDKDKYALPIYQKIVRRFSRVNDTDIQEIIAAAMINKAYTHGVLDEKTQELRTYEQIITRFEQSDEILLQIYVAKALVNSAIAYLRARKYDDAIKSSDDIFKRFKTINNLPLQQQVSTGLLVKGDALSANKRKAEAIQVYDLLIRRYRTIDTPVLQHSVAMALIKKGNQFINVQQATNVYDQVIDEFGNSPDPVLQEQVAMALINKAGSWFRAEDFDGAIELYDDVEKRFGEINSPSIMFLVANALINKAGILININHNKRAIKSLDKVINRLANIAESGFEQYMAWAQLNKMIAYIKLKKWEEVKVTYDQIIERYPNNTDKNIDDYVVTAMYQYSLTLNVRELRLDAVNIIDEVIERFLDSSRVEVQEVTAKALVLKGDMFGQMNRHEESVSAYKEVLQRFRKSSAQALNEQLASALNGIGFQMLLEAKLILLNGNKRSARAKLLKAEERIKAALDRNPSIPSVMGILLGNLSYISFLLGNKQEARRLMQRAIRYGGELIRKAELKDTTIYTLNQDRDFRALIRSVT